jgi:hypothetical protein
MTVVVTHLNKVMDIFSDILTKEFKPVPGTYNYRRDPDSTAKPKGKTAERELISDGATPDDATFVEGLEKTRILKAFGVMKSDRTIQQAKKADKSHKRDLGQAAMQGRQERLTGMRPTLMTTEIRDTKPLGQMATDPQKVGVIRGQRRRANKRLDREEARRNVSDTTKKRQAAQSAAKVTGGVMAMKSAGNRHGLHPVERRPKTVTEKADGGEEYSSGARGGTPSILGMVKARRKRVSEMTGAEIRDANKRGELTINRSYRPGQAQHPEFAAQQAEADKDNTPEPREYDHGDTLPEPTPRGGRRPGSTRHGEIPKGGWKEAALLYPAHQKEQQGGRKVKTRVGDSPTGYPT